MAGSLSELLRQHAKMSRARVFGTIDAVPEAWNLHLPCERVLDALPSGVFIAQTASQSHLRVAAPAGARVTAAGIYITCYYLGGTAAGVVPGAFWAFGKWPACVVFIVFMQIVALTIALLGWRTPVTDQSPEPVPSAAS